MNLPIIPPSPSYEFKVLKENDAVIGFSLVGVGDTDAESYCLGFPTAINLNKGKVAVEDGDVVFTHEGLTIKEGGTNSILGGILKFPIGTEEGLKLMALLDGRDEYAGKQPRIKFVKAWARGFELRAA